MRLGALSKGSARRTVGESWTAESQTSIGHARTHSPAFSALLRACVCVCVREEVIKERTRLAMFTLSFCFPYKSQSHNISFSRDSCATQKARAGRRRCYLAP